MTGWSNSTRRQRLPRDWPKRRAQAKARANGKCEALNNGRDQPPQPHAPGCTGTGSECDHIIAGDNHSMSNLQWLSGECHKAKTLREAQAGRFNRSNRRRRPVIPAGLKIN